MKTNETIFNERVVEMVETCDGVVVRTFYCIHDSDFGHWMSWEPFDRLIWTKDVRCRREFESRLDAEIELVNFLRWRRKQEAGDESCANPRQDQEAA